MSGIFDLFDGHCDRQNGLHIHFARQPNFCYGDGDGVAWCERALTDNPGLSPIKATGSERDPVSTD